MNSKEAAIKHTIAFVKSVLCAPLSNGDSLHAIE